MMLKSAIKGHLSTSARTPRAVTTLSASLPRKFSSNIQYKSIQLSSKCSTSIKSINHERFISMMAPQFATLPAGECRQRISEFDKIIDVREHDEWVNGSVKDAIHIPMGRLIR
jgi:hypothetical protein